jgi:hypothetical protein
VVGPVLDRRRLLRGGVALGTGAAAAAFLAGCGDDGDDEASGPAGGADAASALIAAFPRSMPHVPAGVEFRLPYLLADAEGVPKSEIDGPVRFTVRRDGGTVGDAVEVAPRADGVPRAYLPLTFTFPEPGTYDVVADVDGTRLESALEVHDPAQIATPIPGGSLPAVPTPTTVDATGVDPICTRTDPCPFHEVDLATAVGQGRPVVLLIATPAYCQTAVCGPIVDLLVDVAGDRDDLAVVHAEVYANPTAVDDIAQATPAPIVSAYELAFEPTMYVADGSGLIVARADVTVDRTEMEELIARVA